MKIAVGVHQFLPEYFTGTEVLTMRTARELQARGHEVIIYTGFPQFNNTINEVNAVDEYYIEGLRVKRLLGVPNGGYFTDLDYENKFFGDYFAKELVTERFDLVHFFHALRLGIAALRNCRQRKVPVIFSITDFWSICPFSQLVLPDQSLCPGPETVPVNCLRHSLQFFMADVYNTQLKKIPDRIYSRFLDQATKGDNSPALSSRLMSPTTAEHVIDMSRKLIDRPAQLQDALASINRLILPSRVIQRIFKEHGFSQHNQSVLPYGLEFTGLKRRNDRGTAKTFQVGFIGSIIPQKGVHVLAKAIHDLKNENDCRFTIYGNAADNPEYTKKLLKIVGKDTRVRFAGTFPSSEIWTILDELDCLVVPSTWYENTPLVLLSAQAAGCPTIVTDFEGMSEVVNDGINGFLFPSEDDRALASCIRKLNRNRSLLQRLSENCQPQLSISQYVDKLELIYKEETA